MRVAASQHNLDHLSNLSRLRHQSVWFYLGNYIRHTGAVVRLLPLQPAILIHLHISKKRLRPRLARNNCCDNRTEYSSTSIVLDAPVTANQTGGH